MERIDDLGLGTLKLIQDTDLFCFGTDSVLLSDFARVPSGSTVVDLCTGNGIIPVLLSHKSKAQRIYGIELQKPSYDLAVRNAQINNLSPRVEFIHDDIQNWSKYFACGSVDVVTCNPPYMSANSGFINPKDEKAIARHEIMTNIEGVVDVCSKLLKFGGHVYMVHRADRLCDIVSAMRSRKIEPKRIAFIHPSPQKAPNLILIDGMLGANPSLKIENPIYVNI